MLVIGDVKCVMNEGMPRYRSPFEKGRLIITFEVCVPHIMMVAMI